ncbi:PREDICTED: uncharacterized protein LOC106810851 [Priapulus caudatus]|uniref:Uncharacterized protein LOC106810851 n=1 Tax=Priapulus caudatus TaxID=37621 RepID=A0ABM1EC87_PRICU|nr:PREDICTED: uncharacterized protein LOC106810851 [Priapulus caudatus]
MADSQVTIDAASRGSAGNEKKDNSPLKLLKKLALKEKETSKKTVPDEENAVVVKKPTRPLPPEVMVDSLPQLFHVRYLGWRPTQGLWGVGHTRKPVDELIDATRKHKEGDTLPELQLHVSDKGVHSTEVPENRNKNFASGLRCIDSISYGVQDVRYTRVFAMIVVRTDSGTEPKFECHAYVCSSRASARRLAFSLALAFKEFGKQCASKKSSRVTKKFAIDLRSPEEIENDMAANQELDSEA